MFFTVDPNVLIAGNDDTLFVTGDQYILFLTQETHYKYEFYWLTGAIQGAFRIKDRGQFDIIIGTDCNQAFIESPVMKGIEA